jgi:hypothetical protein
MVRHPIDSTTESVIEYGNMTFFAVFVCEMILKLVAMGVRGYCKDRFNVFDAFIVIVSTIELIINYGTGEQDSSTGAISAFRGFRLLRMLKLLRSWTSLRRLLETIAQTLMEVNYFVVIMLLFIFIYTLLGMEFYAHRLKFDARTKEIDRHGESPRLNFDDFFHAFVTIFSILVGDDWQYILYNAIRSEGYAISVLYFVTLIVLGTFILFNLFLAILIGNFESVKIDEKRLQNRKSEKEEEQKKNQEMQAALTDENYTALLDRHKSLFVFSITNPVRKLASKIIYHKAFDPVILVLIVVSSVLLAI